MSLDNARLAYPILVRVARELASAARDRRATIWMTYDDFCMQCKDVGIKETPRTVMAKLLKPLQAFCLEHSMPDLTSLVIQKPKARADFGDLHRPSDGWWEAYVTNGEIEAVNVPFWFKKYQTARDFAEYPEAPFF